MGRDLPFLVGLPLVLVAGAVFFTRMPSTPGTLRGHGGIGIGSETAGGIRNVYAFDCAFNGTDRIVRIISQ